jgi:hypothetical protein
LIKPELDCCPIQPYDNSTEAIVIKTPVAIFVQAAGKPNEPRIYFLGTCLRLDIAPILLFTSISFSRDPSFAPAESIAVECQILRPMAWSSSPVFAAACQGRGSGWLRCGCLGASIQVSSGSELRISIVTIDFFPYRPFKLFHRKIRVALQVDECCSRGRLRAPRSYVFDSLGGGCVR